MATEYLVGLGHNELVYHISGPLYTVSGQKRFQGFLEVMQEHHVDHKVFTADNFGFEDGYIQAQKILQEQRLPSAVFVAGDWMALGAMKAFREHGLRIPEDISVIGYDDLEFLKYNSPALTTISQNKRVIGQQAARTLIAQINGETVESMKIPVEIVERDTCQKR